MQHAYQDLKGFLKKIYMIFDNHDRIRSYKIPTTCLHNVVMAALKGKMVPESRRGPQNKILLSCPQPV